jgi:hypothetical protein
MSRHGNLTSAALSSSGIRCWQGFPFTPRSGRTTTSRTPASRCSSCSLFWPKTCPPSRGDVLMARRRRLRPFASDWRDGWSTSRRRRRGFDALSHGLKRSAPARKQTRLTDVECGQTGEAGSAGRRRVADTAPCATTAANARSRTPMQSEPAPAPPVAAPSPREHGRAARPGGCQGNRSPLQCRFVRMAAVFVGSAPTHDYMARRRLDRRGVRRDARRLRQYPGGAFF